VNVVIENKPLIPDPEGETILKDLLLKNGANFVKKVRTAKLLNFEVDAGDRKKAEEIILKMCNDLRLFNPVVSICKILTTSDTD
jgi:phosphoribosylformylglycinamidine synthase